MIHSMLFHSGTITIVRHVDISCFCRFENDFVSLPPSFLLPSRSSSSCGARSIITPVISDPAAPPSARRAAVGGARNKGKSIFSYIMHSPFCVTLRAMNIVPMIHGQVFLSITLSQHSVNVIQ